MKNIDDFLLTKTVTVRQARQWMKDKDDHAKSKLGELIDHRFYNRYIRHIKNIDSGFLIMAVCCLMIETLESFRQGKKDTTGLGKKMFKDFFTTEEKLFPGFKDIASDFYSSIRCGILHQAETTNAWRILRSGPMLDKTNRTIHAKSFARAVEKSLNRYVRNLTESDFTAPIWKYAILKIEDVCENCNVKH